MAKEINFNKTNKEMKFKCVKCGEILNGQSEVKRHKKDNWGHFEYDMIGSKLKLAFA